MEIITITNNRGGTAKTTTTQCLAVGLALKGKKVLIVDSDPQRNLSYAFKCFNAPNDLYKLYTNQCDINQCRYRATYKTTNKDFYIDIIPSSKLLANADNEFTREPYLSLGCNRLLKDNLDLIKNEYDYIIIDTPPTLAILTLNALNSSDYVIIPMQAEVFSILGLANLKEKIDLINRNPQRQKKLYIKGILLTRFTERTILSRDLRESILNATKEYNTKLFNTFIRTSIAVAESQANQNCILIQQPNNNVSIDYMNFVNELLKDKEREDN